MFKPLPLILLQFALSPLVYAADQKSQEKADVAIKLGPDDPKEKTKPGRVDKDAPRNFTTTKSGLKYRILRKGGEQKPKDGDMCELSYKGWLDDGTIFQSSYRRGYSISLPVKRVSVGWTEGIQLIGKGGMIELEMPAELGYGKEGQKGVVPPNARLHFIIELVDIQVEVQII